MTGDFAQATTHQERALRRRLLFRLLRGFDFNAPQFHGEMITAPMRDDQIGAIWLERVPGFAFERAA